MKAEEDAAVCKPDEMAEGEDKGEVPPADELEVTPEDQPAIEGEPVKEDDPPADEQANQLAQLRAELKDVRVAMSKLNGTEPLANTGGADAGNLPRNWNEALAYVAKRDGVGTVKAGAIAAKEFRHLHPATAFLK